MTTIKPYPTYKDSGIPWLGDIPEYWDAVEIRRIFIQNKEKNDNLVERNLLSLSYGKLVRKDIDKATGLVPASFEGYQIIYPGYIVLRFTDLQNDKTSLRVGFVHERGIITSAYVGIKPKEGLNSKFFYYQLHFLDKIKHFYNSGSGVRQSLSFSEFSRDKIALPPLPEQIAIARFLDYKLSKINRFIRKKKAILALYAEKRKSYTRRIVNSEDIQFLRLSSVSKLIQRPIERIGDTIFTPIGLYNRGRGIFFKEPTIASALGDSSFYFVKRGDVVVSGQFAWEGAVALAGEEHENCIASHRYPIFKCDVDIILPEYLFSFLSISEGHLLLDFHSRGAAGRNRPLNPRSFIKEKIPIPSLELQMGLIPLIEKEIELKLAFNREIALVEEYKSALISEAVTGKIDVRDYPIPEWQDEEETPVDEDEDMALVEEGDDLTGDTES